MKADQLEINDYNYNLPDDRIARFPLPNRDDSKLLTYSNKSISDNLFNQLPSLLPENSIAIFNVTKVVPARLIFKKRTGAHIEIFCLEPSDPSEYNSSFASRSRCIWLAVVGNAKKWKGGKVFFESSDNEIVDKISLTAEIVEKLNDKFVILFEWLGDLSFSEVMDICGKVPIPPYLKRDVVASDKERYQTLYARDEGSVAAPTAGLHFTDNIMSSIEKRGILLDELSLHVGAGTFIPVKDNDIYNHNMHSEPFSIKRESIEKILEFHTVKRPIIAVGTTTTRTLESLYYFGLQCIHKGAPYFVEQWEPYNSNFDISVEDSLTALIEWMKSNEISVLERKTEIIIIPGFEFKLVDILITNFHQPKSTLLLLISAFIGNEWRTIYNHALQNDYRFLSYGDSSLLFR